MMSMSFTWVSIWFRRTQDITSIGLFYKKWGSIHKENQICGKLYFLRI